MNAADPAPPAARRAVILDRDGTLIVDPGYLADPEGVQLLPWVGESLRALADAGFLLVVATNQSGVARGKLTPERYREIEARIGAVLAGEGVRLAATYHCPYHPDGVVPAFTREHEDRKPNPGMWLRAARDLGLDLARSYSIGDGERDAVAGKRAGTTAVLLAAERDKWPLPVGGPYDPDFVARDIREAAQWILLREGREALPPRDERAEAP
jgi:D-glycero-D-manno-heptose 1,7-bisphosphate phosphatase